jgi:vacuolar protein sorting-associated protein 41
MLTGLTHAPLLYVQCLKRLLQAIDFAKEQCDVDLWEDLLKYAETRPSKWP